MKQRNEIRPIERSAFQSDVISGKAYDIRLMLRLWEFVRPYRRTFFLSFACLALSSLALLAQPYFLKLAVDRAIATKSFGGLTTLALLFLTAGVVELLFFYFQYTLAMRVAQDALADLRVRVFSHLQRLPMSYFDKNPVGRLVTRMTTDVDVISEMFAAGALTVVMDAFTLAAIAAVMFSLNAKLAAVTLTLLPVLVLAINFFRVRARQSYRLIRERIARINAFLQESISGMAIVQLFVREQRSFADFDERNDSHRQANHRSNVYEASLYSLVEAVSSITIAVAVWYASGRIVEGVIAFGTLVAFIEYIHKMFLPIRDFSSKYTVMQSAMAAAERVFQLLDTRPVTTARRIHVPARIAGRVSFEKVSFAYNASGDGRPPAEEDWVLRDVSFEVQPGETVAIVGATGSGKTTLVKLLMGFYEAQRGAVRIDGADVRTWQVVALRRAVGVVLQDVTLFAGSVGSNITLGRSEIDQEKMEAAARAVHADAFIRRLPGRYEAKVRERGNNFSTGQRQLLSFARTLAYDPAILVLDEATSSVDPETEALVQDALGRLLDGRSAIVIAHRLSTIERADRIVVLHRGTVRETGTHRELLAHNRIYARLQRLQSTIRTAAE